MVESFNPESVVLPEFCAEWHLYANGVHPQKRAYVASELRRLDRAGAPVLAPVLALLDGEAQQIALDALRHNSDGERAIFETTRAWTLRLVEGGTPPSRDAQGRPLAPEKRGKVLVTKIGNLGGSLGATADAQELARFSGDQRRARAQQGRDLYRQVEITREGVTLSLDDAITVMRQWGVGVAAKPYRRGADWRPGSDAAPTNGQLLWLVEEVVPVRPQHAKPEAPATSRRNAA